MKQERSILAGGCFWGMQDLIRKRDGVISTRVGYNRRGRGAGVQAHISHDRLRARECPGTARSPLEQPPRKKCLQVSPAIDDQIDIDALTDDPVDHSVRFEIGLTIVADA